VDRRSGRGSCFKTSAVQATIANERGLKQRASGCVFVLTPAEHTLERHAVHEQRKTGWTGGQAVGPVWRQLRSVRATISDERGLKQRASGCVFVLTPAEHTLGEDAVHEQRKSG
jgi:hypothetical protein